jgi:hypothetical protein
LGGGEGQGGAAKVKPQRAFHWLELLVLSPNQSRTKTPFIKWPDYFLELIPARKA